MARKHLEAIENMINDVLSFSITLVLGILKVYFEKEIEWRKPLKLIR